MSTAQSTTTSCWRRATCLLVTLLVAKALLLALRALDGHGPPPLHGAEALRLVEQDLLLATTWLVCDLQLCLLAARRRRLERGLHFTLWGLYGAVVLFSALNVLIARTLGTPLTAALLGATGAPSRTRSCATPARATAWPCCSSSPSPCGSRSADASRWGPSLACSWSRFSPPAS